MTMELTQERPILMCGDMVRAVLAGYKTNTRRVIKPQPPADWSPIACEWYEPTIVGRDGMEREGPEIFGAYGDDWGVACPYGGPGDRLWVRESFYIDDVRLSGPLPKARPDWIDTSIYYMADGTCCEQIPECACAEVGKPRWRPSIHMPRWASRITLEIVSVSVERVQAISQEDVLAEGAPIPCTPEGSPCLRVTGKFLPSDYMQPGTIPRGYPLTITDAADFERAHFASLWDSINHARGFGWAVNPWVWSVKFKRVKETT